MAIAAAKENDWPRVVAMVKDNPEGEQCHCFGFVVSGMVSTPLWFKNATACACVFLSFRVHSPSEYASNPSITAAAAKDKGGNMPLHWACFKLAPVEVISVLLAAHPDSKSA
jgi:hypothetical protein